ncbi:MAG: DUF2977 domain-containing protein [Ligilactobacillus agilis]|nr:DUF2977 domain-containing protein [Ligilactobacillus agilis]
MQILLNDKNEIVAYSLIGTFENGIPFDKEIPEDFENKFANGKYKFENNQILENKNFVEGKRTIIPNPMQAPIGALAKEVANLTKQNAQLQQSLGALALQLAKEDK